MAVKDVRVDDCVKFYDSKSNTHFVMDDDERTTTPADAEFAKNYAPDPPFPKL